ncbi:MAG TPA: CDP-diacylglycerol--glycerol-3-phosphate 3-phosphatidyltransferase [Candidatus Hydrogenedentes bacterium]|nr:CDP-diacylglycerol--glycerol-3-phosphate 3-phosphatidyltransferase [Candidatus Hydrogenedentota bacterium]
MNPANQLTLARFFMTFVFVGLMAVDHVVAYILAYPVFVAATITDYYDGKIARERNLVTNFGKLFDPVADKVLLAAGFLVLMTLDELRMPAWAVVVILAREFLITGARSLAASEGVVIGANVWGKTKAIIQMVYIFAFLFFAIVAKALTMFFADAAFTGFFQTAVWHASYWAIILVGFFTLYSGYKFVRINWQALRLRDL